MPLKEAYKVRERKKEILEILKHADFLSLLNGLSTSEIADMLNCSISQAYYTLKLLEKEERVVKEKHKGKWLWKLK